MMPASFQDLEYLLPSQFLDSVDSLVTTDDDDHFSCLTPTDQINLAGEFKNKCVMTRWPLSSNGEFSPPTTPFLFEPARIQNLGHSARPSNEFRNQSRIEDVINPHVKPAGRLQDHRQVKNGGRRSIVGYESGRGGYLLGLPQSAWPPLETNNNKKQQQSSGTKGVWVMSGDGGKRVCAGTGVFLPRSYANHTHHHSKKSDGVTAERNALLAQEKGNLQADQCHLNHEIKLPPEWIY